VVGFRNVLVHGYISVDTLRISQILAGREYRKLVNLALTGVQLLLGKTLKIRGGRLGQVLNMLVGFIELASVILYSILMSSSMPWTSKGRM
jgi:hypothetical protein